MTSHGQVAPPPPLCSSGPLLIKTEGSSLECGGNSWSSYRLAAGCPIYKGVFIPLLAGGCLLFAWQLLT